MTSLDIIIVNWNSGNQLNECLESINSIDCSNFTLGKVVVVDNSSKDDSLKKIIDNKYFYNLMIHRNNNNAGFAKACNQGANLCHSDFLLFLNPDTKLFKDSLTKVISFCAGFNSKLGVTGIKLINDEGITMKTCRLFPTKIRRLCKVVGLSKIFPSLSVEMSLNDHNELREVEQVMGAFFIISNELFKKFNGFDERYFVYYEEVDLCKRVHDMGYKNYFFPYSKAYHKGGGTSNQVKDLRLFYSLRSWLKYEKKFNGFFGAFTAFLIELLEYVTRLLYLLLTKRVKEVNELNRAYIFLIKDLYYYAFTKTFCRRKFS